MIFIVYKLLFLKNTGKRYSLKNNIDGLLFRIHFVVVALELCVWGGVPVLS